MLDRIPKEVLENIEKELEDDYILGFKSGIQFAKENDLSTIEAVVKAIEEHNMDRFCQVIHDEEYESYCNSSSKYQEGYYKALKEILKRIANLRTEK